MIALLTLTAVWCLGWIGHYRSIDQRAQLAWVEMTFFGVAVVLSLNTKVDGWSIVDWIFGLCAVIVLYGAGITASRFVEKLLARQTQCALAERQRHRSRIGGKP